jgi:hypothetical protein
VLLLLATALQLETSEKSPNRSFGLPKRRLTPDSEEPVVPISSFHTQFLAGRWWLIGALWQTIFAIYKEPPFLDSPLFSAKRWLLREIVRSAVRGVVMGELNENVRRKIEG